jgi:hypothetical protein
MNKPTKAPRPSSNRPFRDGRHTGGVMAITKGGVKLSALAWLGFTIRARRTTAGACSRDEGSCRPAFQRWHASRCFDRESNQVVPISHTFGAGIGGNELTIESGHEFSPTARPYLPN